MRKQNGYDGLNIWSGTFEIQLANDHLQIVVWCY